VIAMCNSILVLVLRVLGVMVMLRVKVISTYLSQFDPT
jgi:hypothetical protein